MNDLPAELSKSGSKKSPDAVPEVPAKASISAPRTPIPRTNPNKM